jgi:hypothetical protein
MMNARTAIVGLALTLLAAPGVASTVTTGIPGGERSALRSLEDPALHTQRAGAVALRSAIGAEERDQLRSAEAASTQLADMRAGEVTLTDRDITLIAIVAAVILIIIIVA